MCAQYLSQKPVEDLDFKIMFVVVILFRSCSSLQLTIAMRIFISHIMGYFLISN